MKGPAVGIVKLTAFAKLQMGNGKWQIKGHFVPIVKLTAFAVNSESEK